MVVGLLFLILQRADLFGSCRPFWIVDFFGREAITLPSGFISLPFFCLDTGDKVMANIILTNIINRKQNTQCRKQKADTVFLRTRKNVSKNG